jgi:mRNA interferase HicA
LLCNQALCQDCLWLQLDNSHFYHNTEILSRISLRDIQVTPPNYLINIFQVDLRTFLSEYSLVRGNEFIKRVLRTANQRGIAARVDAKRGKGSHVTLYFGERRTIVRNPKDELKTGTLHAMLKQLGLHENDL